ncbi:Uncharacterized protein GmHk_17G049530 [Glycine max]|nr:Uncharacterized protein GmHk_17G049530 [Glycine max]KAH1203247.1 Uncharacterized protein GmHk_17G049530 [Glycine max]
MGDEKGEKKEKTSPSASGGNDSKKNEKKKKGFISRIWNAIFRSNRDDFEKRLEYITKEENMALTRLSNRSRSWRRTSRQLILFSVLFEVIAVGYAIMTTRSMDMNWKMRAIRVLPMFLLPALSSATYTAFVSFTRIYPCQLTGGLRTRRANNQRMSVSDASDRKDQKILESLRAERKAKIDELKEKTNYYITQQLIQLSIAAVATAIAAERHPSATDMCVVARFRVAAGAAAIAAEQRGLRSSILCHYFEALVVLSGAESLRAERKAKIDELNEKTNYYITQQLIQRYDTDPAAKAAAATVLASKLGADSGLKVYVGDESSGVSTGKTKDVEVVQSSGLRNRKQVTSRSTSPGTTTPNYSDQQLVGSGKIDQTQTHEHNQLVVVEHHNPQSSTMNDGGWIARIAALLVGEDPTQSYALICGNCHMHNGLARKEDFPFITYYCPHCHALNKPKQSDERISGLNSHNTQSPKTDDGEEVKNASDSAVRSVIRSDNPVNTSPEIEEVSEPAISEEKS